jgi:glycosyltransferase involved in cell wall biosynthesis
MLKLSIITVNLNDAEGLRKTIQGVINQTFKDFEFIVIDGGSKDGSQEVIKEFSQRIVYSISENDNGIYDAMNKGISRAVGDYCMFLNSGDYLVGPDILSEIFSHNFSEDIISGAVITYSNLSNYKYFHSNITSSEITLSDLFEGSLNHQATLIKRSLFEKYGPYEKKFRIISDWIFTIKTIIFNNVSYRYLDIPIAYYNIDGKSATISDYYSKENLPALKELIPPRILSDYETGYVHILKRMKKYFLFWAIFRFLNLCTLKYDNIYRRFTGQKKLKRHLSE